MKLIIPIITAILFLHLHLTPTPLFAAVPLRWTVETSRVQPVAFDAVHGESIALEATFKSYGTDVQLPATAALYYQTNGMGSAWWTIPASVSSNRITAVFAPTNDPGAASVSGFIGTTGEIFRAAFTLRFRKGPGATPNTLELPTPTIDCAEVTFLNPSSAPWSGGGSAGTDGAAVTNIVDGIVASSNLCTVAAAAAMTNDAAIVRYDADGEAGAKLKHGGTAVTASDVGALPGLWNGLSYEIGGNLTIPSGLYLASDLIYSASSATPQISGSFHVITSDRDPTEETYQNSIATLGDIPTVPTAWPATSITNANGTSAWTTNNAELVATVTNLAPASAKSVAPHDPVLDCDWVLNVTNGVFYWTVKE